MLRQENHRTKAKEGGGTGAKTDILQLKCARTNQGIKIKKREVGKLDSPPVMGEFTYNKTTTLARNHMTTIASHNVM